MKRAGWYCLLIFAIGLVAASIYRDANTSHSAASQFCDMAKQQGVSKCEIAPEEFRGQIVQITVQGQTAQYLVLSKQNEVVAVIPLQ